MTIVHRFTSPEWLKALQSHLAGVSLVDEESKRDIRELFKTIVNLRAGQALLFSPTAMLDVRRRPQKGENSERAIKLGMRYVEMYVRKRLTTDGGQSIMAT